MSDQKKLNRRDFLKGAAISGAGLAAVGALGASSTTPVAAQVATPAPTPTSAVQYGRPGIDDVPVAATPCPSMLPAKWDKEADVVVIGLGSAGLVAAIEARNAGVSVIALEKAAATGGGSILCGGQFAAAGPTSLQKEKGITKATPDLMYDDLMRIGNESNVPELVRTYVDASNDCFEFLKALGVTCTTVGVPAGGSLEWDHRLIPPQVDELERKAAQAKGAELMLQTEAKELIANPTGQVVGVKVETGGKTLYVKARRAVVLTSGGFCWSAELLSEAVPMMAFALKSSAKSNTGDGLLLARKIGAGTKDMPYVKATFGSSPDPNKFSWRAAWNGAIIVNRSGKRVVNESLDYKRLGDAVLPQEGHSIFQIMDQAILDAKDPWYGPPSAAAIASCKEANTIEELAQQIGVPPEELKATVDKYNGYVQAGNDPEFGRTCLEIPAYGNLRKIEKAPFYATETTAAILGTYGGITFDKACHVTDVFGKIIPRLYAAGEVTGGFHGGGYMTGSAYGKAHVFGRIAGKNAAAEKPWE